MKKLFDNKIFKALYFLFKTCCVLILVLYLSFIIIQRLSGNKSIFGYRLFNVATGSMTGVYDINDVIAVKDFDTKKLKVGDDIAYRGTRGGLDGLLITHRIIKIETKENGSRIITTQGVNAPISDPTIEESQILGKVVGVVPVISQLNHILKSQVGFFLLVFLPLFIILTLEVLQTITDIKLERKEIKEIERDSKEKKNSDKNESEKSEKDGSEKNSEDNKKEKEDSEEESDDSSVDDKVKEEDKEKSEKDGSEKNSEDNKKEKEDSEEESDDSSVNDKVKEEDKEESEKDDKGENDKSSGRKNDKPKIIKVVDDIEIL